MTPTEFYNYTIGKKFDIDGVYKNQCVDLFILFCNKHNIPYANTVTGWAGGLWTHRKEHYKKYFDLITTFNHLKTGDWIFTTNPEHVAMWYNGKMLGQNQGGNLEAVNLKEFTGRFLGAYRYKGYSTLNTTLDDELTYLAKKVINGNFSNGAERKEKIFRYVQDNVNAYLRDELYDMNIKKIVENVIKGAYGNGEVRKNNVYITVQDKVNEILKK